MPNDLVINTQNISIRDISGIHQGSSVRTYTDTTPGGLCLQIRKTDPITTGNKAKKRNMLAHVVLNTVQVHMLRGALSEFLKSPRKYDHVGNTMSAGIEVNNIKFEIRTDNAQQAYDMAQLMLIVGNAYGGACCVRGGVNHGPWPALPGDRMSHEARGIAAAIMSLFEK